MADRFYYREDNKYRSVTTIIGKVCPKPALTQWAANVAVDKYASQLMYGGTSGNLDGIAQEAKTEHQRVGKLARNIGSVVHNFTEQWDDGRLEFPSLVEKYATPVQNCMDAYNNWIKKFEPKIVKSEHVVYCNDPIYAGTLDRIIKLDNVKYRGKTYNGAYIVDIKTSKSCYNPEYGMQLAAYRNAVGQEIDGMAVVRLDKESGKFGWHDMSDDYEFYFDMFFCAALMCEVQDRLKEDKKRRRKK